MNIKYPYIKEIVSIWVQSQLSSSNSPEVMPEWGPVVVVKGLDLCMNKENEGPKSHVEGPQRQKRIS